MNSSPAASADFADDFTPPDTVPLGRRIVHCPKSRFDQQQDQHLAELLISVQRAIGGDAVFLEEDKSRKMWRAFTGASFEKSTHRAEWGTKPGALRRLRNVGSNSSESIPPRDPRTSTERYGPTHSSASVLDALANRARHAKVPMWKMALRVTGIGLAALVVLAAILVLALYAVTRWNSEHTVTVARVPALTAAPAVVEATEIESAPLVAPRRHRRAVDEPERGSNERTTERTTERGERERGH